MAGANPRNLETRKHRVDLLQGLLPVGLGSGMVGAQPEILPHAQIREHAPALEYVRETETHDIVGGLAVDALARELDAAGTGLEQPRDGIEDRAFSRAIGPEKTHHLAFPHLQGNAPDHLVVAVADLDVRDLKHKRHPDRTR
jgi:hypothetical protein